MASVSAALFVCWGLGVKASLLAACRFHFETVSKEPPFQVLIPTQRDFSEVQPAGPRKRVEGYPNLLVVDYTCTLCRDETTT